MINKKNILLAFCFSLLTLIVTYIFIKPVLDSQDDVFTEFILGNGLSAATIHTTYFEYGFLCYENVFSFLYKNFSYVNWLTFFYSILHLTSAAFIIYIFLKNFKSAFCIFIVASYLCLFFIPFITKISYTATAAHCIVSCIFVFMDSIKANKNPSIKKLLVVFIVLTFALGLRIQIFLPIILIVLPLFFLVKKEYLIKWAITFIASIAVATTALFIHVSSYQKKIPDWLEINQTTNAFYNLENYGYDEHTIADEKDSLKRTTFEMVKKNFIYDDALLKADFLNEMRNATNAKIIGNKNEFYWLLTDIKQYLIILMTAFVFVMAFIKKSKIKTAIICTNSIAAIVCAYAILFMRLPERIWMPVFLLLFLVDLYPLHLLVWNDLKIIRLFLFPIAAIPLIIQAKRIKDIKICNEEGIQNFICANKILKQHPQNLFIEYNNGFPFNNFPALSLPSQYSFINILFPFFFNTELRTNTMKRFNIKSVNRAICSSNNIILIGNADASLAEYIYQTQGQKIFFEKISSVNCCINLYKVNTVK